MNHRYMIQYSAGTAVVHLVDQIAMENRYIRNHQPDDYYYSMILSGK